MQPDLVRSRVQYRWLKHRDLAAVYEIEARSFAEPFRWNEDDFALLFQRQYLVAEVILDSREHVLGYSVYEMADSRSRNLLRVVVHPAWRRRGVGRQAVNRFVENKGRLAIASIVHERHLEGQCLLRACGWRCVKTLRGHYATGDAYRFELATVENES